MIADKNGGVATTRRKDMKPRRCVTRHCADRLTDSGSASEVTNVRRTLRCNFLNGPGKRGLIGKNSISVLALAQSLYQSISLNGLPTENIQRRRDNEYSNALQLLSLWPFSINLISVDLIVWNKALQPWTIEQQSKTSARQSTTSYIN
jgi:hypothetical protein